VILTLVLSECTVNYFGVLGCFRIFELDFEADFEAFEELIVLEGAFLPFFSFEPFSWCWYDFFTLMNDSFKNTLSDE